MIQHSRLNQFVLNSLDKAIDFLTFVRGMVFRYSVRREYPSPAFKQWASGLAGRQQRKRASGDPIAVSSKPYGSAWTRL